MAKVLPQLIRSFLGQVGPQVQPICRKQKSDTRPAFSAFLRFQVHAAAKAVLLDLELRTRDQGDASPPSAPGCLRK